MNSERQSATRDLHTAVSLIDEQPTSLKQWSAFVSQEASAGFYHQLDWRDIIEREFGHKTFYLIARRRGVAVGILPLVLIRSRLFGNILCSLPFLSYCGPSAYDSAACSSLLSSAFEIADEQNVDFLEIRGRTVSDPSLPRSQHKISMTVDLPSDSEEMWNSYKSKHRTNIRRAQKSGIVIRSGHNELLDDFFEVMCHSWRSLGTPIYRHGFFQTILDRLGKQTRVYVAYSGHRPVAAAFNGHHKKTVEGMWAGMIPDYRRSLVNYALYWEMIKEACDAGYEIYNLGRSTVSSGGESFKRKWNADIRQLYWQYYLPHGGEIPQINVSNEKYRVAISLWKKMPIWATKLIGPGLSRSIP